MTTETPTLPFDLAEPYGLDGIRKHALLLEILRSLTHWHEQHCEPYGRMSKALFGSKPAASLSELPYLPVRLFKTLELRSVDKAQITKTLTSSGTTGQAVSRIYLDRETAIRQTRVLTAIMSNFLGSRRQPMVIVDSAELLRDRTRFNARAAGILGFSVFGRQHHYCLDEHLQLKPQELEQFMAAQAGESILLFGFTFVVWQGLYRGSLKIDHKLNFGPGSTLIHGGGWKKLLDQSVSNDQFKESLHKQLGIERVFNYYGMVEQVGSIFMECEHGHLHSPVFADVIIRDPVTLAPLPFQKPGVIQVLSALPLSYPGHSLLTEDTGMIHGEDDCPCGRLGKYFSVFGRLPQAEARGCSDTRAMP